MARTPRKPTRRKSAATTAVKRSSAPQNRRKSSRKPKRAAAASGSGSGGGGGTLRYTLIMAAVWLTLGSAVLLSHWISQLPDTSDLLAYAPSRVITVNDVHGRRIERRGLVQGQFVRVGELPDHVTNAFIAIEDRRFRSHFGVDPVGMIRAMFADIARGRLCAGRFHHHPAAGQEPVPQARTHVRAQDRKRRCSRSVWRARYTKDEILTLYLNRVYFGAGVYGIEAAADNASSTSRPRSLTLTEVGDAGGRRQGAVALQPGTRPRRRASSARQVVLAAMARRGLHHAERRARRGGDAAQDRTRPRRRPAQAISSTT